MFIIRCEGCGREVEWQHGVKLGTLEIEYAGSEVICACGRGICEDEGVLREFNLSDANGSSGTA